MNTENNSVSIHVDGIVTEEMLDKDEEQSVGKSFDELQSTFSIKDVISEFIIKKGDFVVIEGKSKIEDIYEVVKPLGKGTFGDVYIGRHKKTGEERAVKMIPRSKIQGEKFIRFVNEVSSLKVLDHPNIVKLFEVYQEKDFVYLVQELWTGGELLDYIVKMEYLSEKEAAEYFKQILQAIRYCNVNKISHRDLKPENFMFESTEKGSKLKLIDFGLSKSYFINDQVTRMKTYAGTPYFMSPEVIIGNYSHSWDMWSAGVMLYIMLSGYPPFYGVTIEETLRAIADGTYDFEDDVWDEVSEEAKDLISKCLVREKERILPKEALNHPWVKQKDIGGKISVGHMDRLKDFQKAKRLKKAALAYIASRTSDSCIQDEMDLFSKLDKNKDGYITLKELKEGMKEFADIEEVAEILEGIDIDRNGAINYTEFIAATLDQNKIFAEKFKLREVFNALDKDGSGYIDAGDLQEVLEKEGSEVWKQVIEEIDKDGDKRVNYEEFKSMMEDLSM